MYSNTGEQKKIPVRYIKKSMLSLRDKMYLSYLKSWPIDTAPCILDRKNAKYYIKHFNILHKTNIMKEIIKQLRTI